MQLVPGQDKGGPRRTLPNPGIDRFVAVGYFTAAVVGLGVVLLAGAMASRFYVSMGDAAQFPPLRTLHSSFAAGWILLAAHGFILACLPAVTGVPLWSRRLAFLQLGLFILAGIGIVFSTILDLSTGREYLNFSPVVSPVILLAAILMAVNLFASFRRTRKVLPVYAWMWGTGILLFLWTFLEAHLWLFPSYSRFLIRDMTVQWKSYGALVGSWNLMIYGLTFFCMDRLSGGTSARTHRLWRAVFWLAFGNALFGWAHHTYQLPQAQVIRWIAFVLSMTEILFLVKAIYDFSAKGDGTVPRLLFRSGGFWIVTNLVLSLVISVPRLNGITHGTQITVAHAMGTMIGINLLLLAGVGATIAGSHLKERLVLIGMKVFHVSLSVFLLALVWMGLNRGALQLEGRWSWLLDFESGRDARLLFVGAGIFLIGAILMIILPVLRGLIQGARSGKEDDISISGNSPPRIGLSGAVALSLVLFGGGGLGLWYGGQERVETSLRVGEEGRGKFLYERNCLSCHGLDAGGTDKAPSLIEKKYPNQYLWLRVSGGGLKMPPIPGLEESDVREISRYLESIDR